MGLERWGRICWVGRREGIFAWGFRSGWGMRQEWGKHVGTMKRHPLWNRQSWGSNGTDLRTRRGLRLWLASCWRSASLFCDELSWAAHRSYLISLYVFIGTHLNRTKCFPFSSVFVFFRAAQTTTYSEDRSPFLSHVRPSWAGKSGSCWLLASMDSGPVGHPGVSFHSSTCLPGVGRRAPCLWRQIAWEMASPFGICDILTLWLHVINSLRGELYGNLRHPLLPPPPPLRPSCSSRKKFWCLQTFIWLLTLLCDFHY